MESLIVNDGDEVVISTRTPGNLAGNIRKIKPNSVVAIKALLGVQGYTKFLNIDDNNLFSEISDSDSRSLVDFDGELGYANGYNSSLVGSIISRLADDKPIPHRIKLDQVSRRRLTPEIVRSREIGVPDYLRDMEFFANLFFFKDTVLKKGSVLVFDHDAKYFSTNNLYMYSNSRIIQRSSKLIMRVYGEMEGKD